MPLVRHAVPASPGAGLPQRGPGRLTDRRTSLTTTARRLKDHLRDNLYPPNLVHSTATAFESEDEDATIFVQVATQWNTWPSGEFRSFANSTRTHEGSAHERGFRGALSDIVNDYARRQRHLCAEDEDITTEAIYEGLTAVVSVKLAHPVFEGADRTKLSNPEADTYVHEVVREHLTHWFDHHPNEAATIIHRILSAST
ncbi:hypothetical protein [Streptomyces sp. cmx-4-9]|uniref:hypothetical protein n=1 Tax=Streptomyces sp. cmx-4-9 TaxID=2790941 RepID=UPI00397EA1DC